MLRKDLLSAIEVKEFCPESLFVNPSASMKISTIICDYCNYSSDIDFCRDEEKDIWTCPNCRKFYNKVFLEEELIKQLNILLFKYMTQDYECNKCHSIRSDNMSEYCKCSGRWTETVKFAQIKNRLKVFSNVSAHFGFKMLRSLTEEIA